MDSNQVEASLHGSRVLVWSKEDSGKLYRSGFYGKPINVSKPKDASEINSYLELSLLEANYLLEKGLIKVKMGKKILTREQLLRLSKKQYRLFNELYAVYKDLRDKGYVVRPALKFGADFAVYQYGPGIDHAPFIIHVLPNSAEIDPIEIVRAGRLSHTVRKKFVLATFDEVQKKVIYYMFDWWKA
ncbi:MAG: tRNA-intron lyase [Candidatus Methanomethyliaceae archaeon]|nr:tRNA-intron lyase [Candidatus Methanomethyliaceae archaeon]